MEEEKQPQLIFFPAEEDTSNNDKLKSSKQSLSSQMSIKIKVSPTTYTEVDEVTELRDQLTDSLTRDDVAGFAKFMVTFEKQVSQGIIKGLLDERLLMDGNGFNLLQRTVIRDNFEIIKTLLPHCDESVFNHRNRGPVEGGTVLHDCVIKDRQDIIKIIADKLSSGDFKALLASQAVGSFIKTNFQGHELPLFLACWTRNLQMIRYLLTICPEALYMTDSNGQNLLHCLVNIAHEGGTKFAASVFKMIFGSTGGKVAIEHLLIKTCKTPQHERPLSYALRLGELSFAQLIINTSLKNEKVQYGPARFTEYDITDLEVCPEVRKADFIPGIIMIGTSSNLNRLQSILHMEPWVTIQNLRWDYYKFSLLRMFITQAIMLILMTIGIIMTPTRALSQELRANFTAQQAALNQSLTLLQELGYFGTEGTVTFVFQNIFTLYGISIFVSTLFYLMKMVIISQQRGLQFSEFVQRMSNPVTGNGIYIFLSLLFSLSIILGNIAVYFNYPEVDILFMLELIAGFCSMTFYFRCLDYTSFFTVTVNKMLFGDVVRFCAIISGYLVGFGGGFYVMFKNKQGGPPEEASNFGETLVTTYRLMIGMADFSTLKVDYELIVVILYIAYTILMTIMLFNMLIGIMANTINDVSDKRKYLGNLQRLSTLIYAEQTEFRKPFASRCVQNGKMKVKTVPFAGTHLKRLFIECLEIQNEDESNEVVEEKQKYILGIKINNPLKNSSHHTKVTHSHTE
ncbi:unnamed protein product [Owenia fusiformis]|uniref:Uncharacterized protein n=1 Tax=Owenia fusiformis TaxID=6347 RepID=A0A8J1Y5A0_OWEFU|nr:unnamed protein product [Owenia fusiformis]